MKVEPISFYELARASHIKRWHIVNTTKQQNLAEHQYNVTVIAMALLGKILSIQPSPAFVLAALFHDSAEIRYGDIPTPGKAFMKEFMEDRELFNNMDDLIMPGVPYTNGATIKEMEADIIKLADLIEAAWWIKENGAGAHAKVVADKCWAAAQEYVHARKWYDDVNPILMDLGMPAINPNLRSTPP